MKAQGKCSASDAHHLAVIASAHLFDGEIVVIKGNSTIKGKYFPDVRTKDSDIECEQCPRRGYILEKAKKWDSSRKKILVMSIPPDVESLFDEIYILNGIKMTRLK